MKQDEPFRIKAYGKSELAMLYFPESTKEAALKRLNFWLKINPRLRHLLAPKIKNFTPRQVREIVDEVGEPFET